MSAISKKLAVDMAILPPIDVMEALIAINQQAASQGAAWGPLAKDDFLPHISLAMGGVEHENLGAVRDMVERVTKRFSPIPVELNELSYVEETEGSRFYAIRAKKTPDLQQLHESLMNGLRQYFSYDCTKETLFSKLGEEVTKPDYINKFATLYSFKAFDPHITIRTRRAMGQEVLPLKFTATKVAACHVGKMATCRNVLFEVGMAS